ncbi:MAG: hypothetical protein GXO79_08930 [Chlorobi bacterium]|nr:hypothetical protein [Chlorobiota bacterium]
MNFNESQVIYPYTDEVIGPNGELDLLNIVFKEGANIESFLKFLKTVFIKVTYSNLYDEEVNKTVPIVHNDAKIGDI